MLIPLKAYAHGEEVLYGFDMVIVVALFGGLMLCKKIPKRNKLILTILFVAAHGIGWATIFNVDFGSRLMSMIVPFIKDDGLASSFLTFLMLYFLPLLLCGIAGYFLKAHESSTTKD